MTVQAERLNFLRFISHFRAVHRGASFAGLRTTSVRKLLPEYVFVCLFFRFYSSTFIVANVLCALSLSLSLPPTIVQILGFYMPCSHT